jgi:hypothetical protein
MLLKRRRRAHTHEVVSCWGKGRLGCKEPYHLTGNPSQFSNALTLSTSPQRLGRKIHSSTIPVFCAALTSAHTHVQLGRRFKVVQP